MHCEQNLTTASICFYLIIQVIKAWDESVLTMTIGEQARIVATPDYAYGASGFPAWGIMPNSDLAFDIEVLKYSYTAS